MAAAAQKFGMFLCVQDLTCPGASLIHSAGIAARVPGNAGIEANARQFVPAANQRLGGAIPRPVHDSRRHDEHRAAHRPGARRRAAAVVSRELFVAARAGPVAGHPARCSQNAPAIGRAFRSAPVGVPVRRHPRDERTSTVAGPVAGHPARCSQNAPAIGRAFRSAPVGVPVRRHPRDEVPSTLAGPVAGHPARCSQKAPAIGSAFCSAPVGVPVRRHPRPHRFSSRAHHGEVASGPKGRSLAGPVAGHSVRRHPRPHLTLVSHATRRGPSGPRHDSASRCASSKTTPQAYRSAEALFRLETTDSQLPHRLLAVVRQAPADAAAVSQAPEVWFSGRRPRCRGPDATSPVTSRISPTPARRHRSSAGRRELPRLRIDAEDDDRVGVLIPASRIVPGDRCRSRAAYCPVSACSRH